MVGALTDGTTGSVSTVVGGTLAGRTCLRLTSNRLGTFLDALGTLALRFSLCHLRRSIALQHFTLLDRLLRW